MSREELVNAFLDGRISRRTMIRRLVGGGVSMGAAVSYAQMLNPERAGAQAASAVISDHYPLVDLVIASPSFAAVKNNSALLVDVTSSEELVNTYFRAFLKVPGGGIAIGARVFPSVLTAAGTRRIGIPIDAAALGARTRGRFYVQAQGSDAEHYPALASAAKTLV